MRLPVSILALIGGVLFIFLSSGSQAAQQIPFEYRDGLIWVKVVADTKAGAARLNFLLDSGAGASVLNLATAQRLGVEFGGRAKVKRVGEATSSVWRVRDFKATVGGIAVSESPLALDLSDTSALCSRSIDGLLGEDFFRDRIVEIDFRALCLRLLDKADASVHGLCAVMPMKVAGTAMLVAVSVNGSSLRWARLDTGCDDGLHWVADGDAGADSDGYVRSSLQLGRERIINVKTALHRAPIFPSEAGLLGNEVLSNYRVTIDRINGRVTLARA